MKKAKLGRGKRMNCNMVAKNSQHDSWELSSWMALQSCFRLWQGVCTFIVSSTSYRGGFPQGWYLPWWGRSPSTKGNSRIVTQLWASPKWDIIAWKHIRSMYTQDALLLVRNGINYSNDIFPKQMVINIRKKNK